MTKGKLNIPRYGNTLIKMQLKMMNYFVITSGCKPIVL